ncbi:hypothetical protein MTR_7g105950 [Medicago truncatula]|uniref:Uncharacterized protein n=1 Tax=Medicago truncatula TaxID=3880 RepID=A0A072U4Y8_MEDTR|nr:hypothetical protein MTR_7g105950 [Medicago truncatula]
MSEAIVVLESTPTQPIQCRTCSHKTPTQPPNSLRPHLDWLILRPKANYYVEDRNFKGVDDEMKSKKTIVIQVVASQDWPEVTKYAGLRALTLISESNWEKTM